MNHQEHLDKISDLIKDLKFTMMTTVTHEGHLHACPMTTNQFDLARKEIWFIADKTYDGTMITLIRHLRCNQEPNFIECKK
jgi:general stress protein 26